MRRNVFTTDYAVIGNDIIICLWLIFHSKKILKWLCGLRHKIVKKYPASNQTDRVTSTELTNHVKRVEFLP